MTWARVMRGISSMAKAETPALASACSASVWPYGSMMAMAMAPRRREPISPGPGRRTVSTTSASRAASWGPCAIVAPAASNSRSGTPARVPAPAWTTTSAPSALYFLTVSGVAATRLSTGSVSDKTAIRMKLPRLSGGRADRARSRAVASRDPAERPRSVHHQHENEQDCHSRVRSPAKRRREQAEARRQVRKHDPEHGRQPRVANAADRERQHDADDEAAADLDEADEAPIGRFVRRPVHVRAVAAEGSVPRVRHRSILV